MYLTSYYRTQGLDTLGPILSPLMTLPCIHNTTHFCYLGFTEVIRVAISYGWVSEQEDVDFSCPSISFESQSFYDLLWDSFFSFLYFTVTESGEYITVNSIS